MNDPFKETSALYTALSETHQMGRARDINKRALEDHLIFWHSVSIHDARTKAELGHLHTLAHAVNAYPELIELLGLPRKWGK